MLPYVIILKASSAERIQFLINDHIQKGYDMPEDPLIYQQKSDYISEMFYQKMVLNREPIFKDANRKT